MLGEINYFFACLIKKSMDNQQITCPYCGGEGKKYQSDAIKMLIPVLYLVPKFQCKKCKELFKESHREGIPFLEKPRHLIRKVIFALAALWFIWVFIQNLLR